MAGHHEVDMTKLSTIKLWDDKYIIEWYMDNLDTIPMDDKESDRVHKLLDNINHELELRVIDE